MQINFGKYDASCKNGLWTWFIKNKHNTKTIEVKVGFTSPLSTIVDDIYFEEKGFDYKKNYIELVEQVLKYDHNSYGYIENFNDNHNEFKPEADGFLTDEQLSEIQDSSELYKIIRDVYKNAPKVLTDFNKEEK
jgi:hypothetical protein